MSLLKENGVSTENIRNDLWIFDHNLELMQERVELLKMRKIPIKCWMLRCSDHDLGVKISRVMKRRQMVGENDDGFYDFMSKKLNCTDSEARRMVRRHHVLLNVHPPKLEAIIDYLLEEGFTGHQILSFPRILTKSLETVIQRNTDLKSYEIHLQSLSVFILSQKEFEDFLIKESRV
jgi:hypothetical protein